MTVEPVFDLTTERLYSRLPETFRVADVTTDYTLKRYIRGVAAVQGELDRLLARFDRLDIIEQAAKRNAPFYDYKRRSEYTGVDVAGDITQTHDLTPAEETALGWAPIDETSDLTDPQSADVEWLGWMGQLVGVGIDTSALNSDQERRDAVAFASSGFHAGSQQALEDACRSELTGSRYVRVYTHSNLSGIGSGTQWEILLVTKVSETPPSAEVLNAVIRKGAKPAGVVLYHRTYETPWDQTDTLTWDQRDAMTWNQLEDYGV